MRILIADDDVVSALMLRRTLERWGYTVTMVTDGTQALAALQKPDAPKLMILDWMMPGLDGPEVIRAVRSQASEHYNYAILLTSRDQQGDIVEGLEAGADDYIRKPFDSNELRARLRAGQRILDLQSRLLGAAEYMRKQDFNQSVPGPVTGVVPRQWVDEPAVLERMGGSIEMLKELTGLFADENVRRLVNLRAALNVGDALQVSREAHGIKNGLTNFCADEAVALAFHIEKAAKGGSVEGLDIAIDALETALDAVTQQLTAMGRVE